MVEISKAEFIKRTGIMIGILRKIFDFYGCQKCGICCKAFTPVVQTIEIKKISRYLRTKPKKFKNKYCDKLNIPLNRHELKAPCPFLKNGNHCTIYSMRPYICCLYPFELDPFTGTARLISIEICPTATLIYNDVLDFHNKIKYLLNLDEKRDKEIEKGIKYLEDEVTKRRKKFGIEVATGMYTMSSMDQWYFFALYRIEKVDDIEERIKVHYEKFKNKRTDPEIRR